MSGEGKGVKQGYAKGKKDSRGDREGKGKWEKEMSRKGKGIKPGLAKGGRGDGRRGGDRNGK